MYNLMKVTDFGCLVLGLSQVLIIN